MSKFQATWINLLQAKRSSFSGGTETVERKRSPFAKDIDRIIFSDSFRRLAKKSQVHPLAMNDHLHTRLSHSLEVARVGRTLGYAVGSFLLDQGDLPNENTPEHIGEIVQAACLAHDIGNPPFGHAGEEAIREWFSHPQSVQYMDQLSSNQRTDFTCFDGNAQGFRVVTKYEKIARDKAGLDLTYPVLASLVKYPVSSYRADAGSKHTPRKYNYQISERDIFKEVFEKLGLTVRPKVQKRHPLSYLMEVADDICYSIMDLEDAIELRLITFNQFREIYKDIFDSSAIPNANHARREASWIRGKVIDCLVEEAIETFIRYYDKIMVDEKFPPLVEASEKLEKYVGAAKKLSRESVYSESRKIALEIGAYTVYQSLLDTFVPAVHYFVLKRNVDPVPYKYKRALEILNKHTNQNIFGEKKQLESDEEYERRKLYEGYMTVIDYITGMTDNYATFVAQQFLGAGTGPWQI